MLGRHDDEAVGFLDRGAQLDDDVGFLAGDVQVLVVERHFGQFLEDVGFVPVGEVVDEGLGEQPVGGGVAQGTEEDDVVAHGSTITPIRAVENNVP